MRATPILRTLYAKLAVALILLLLAVGLLYLVVSVSATRHHLAVVTQQLNRNLARNLVRERNLVEQGRLNEAALERLFRNYMTINPNIEIYLLDLEGRILSFSGEPNRLKRRQVALEPMRAFLAGAPYPLLGDDPRRLDRQKIFSVTPVPSAEHPEGYLYVLLKSEELDAVSSQLGAGYLLALSGWAVAGSLVLGLLAGLVLFRLLTRRLRRLAGVMERFRHSDFSIHEAYAADYGAGNGGDEIDLLGATFDQMALRLVTLLETLRRTDNLRRELVAQVSHDLRTPLASLHGYLETLQIKDAVLASHERREYLAVALRHSERINRLVVELFELARLDAIEQLVDRETVALPELVQDVAQKLGLKLQEKGLRLNLDLGDSMPFVWADIGLIERVLENLLDNACRHASNGGQVEVSVSQAHGRVTIRVIDDGPGIAEVDLPHIFERFYQSNATSSTDGHAGLGLAIVKRIIELHESEVRVESRPGEGAAFSFTLPVCSSEGGAPE